MRHLHLQLSRARTFAALAALAAISLTATALAAPAITPRALLSPPETALLPLRHRRLAEHFHLRAESLNVLAGRAALVSGTLRPAQRGVVVALQALHNGHWRTVARARTGARARFALRYVAHRDLSEPIRLRFGGDATGRIAQRRVGWLNVYRPVEASWYGGGGSLACGGFLSGSTMGVANRTLPCGTPVTLRYGSRTVRVRVIDRGPYVYSREYDLTEATKRALGFEGTGVIWATR